MFSTDFIFRQQESLVDNQKYQARFRPLCKKILFLPPPCDNVIHGCRKCEDKHFDIKNDKIQFNFNSKDDFCPNVLTIKLKNGPRPIVYSNSHEMTDWFNPKKGGEIRTARKLKGKKKLCIETMRKTL